MSTIKKDFFLPILNTFYKEGKFYKVIFGKLKGIKFFYRKGINFRYILGTMEQSQMKILLKLFHDFGLDKKKMVVTDIGANMGFYSLFFFKYLQRSSTIFSFEPSFSIFEELQKNINANAAFNVKVFDIACADKSGQIEFYIGDNHHTSSTVGEWANHKSLSKKYVVRCTTLDDFFYKYKDEELPDLIKMDIEGGGVFALKGCDRCISKKRPFIIIESHTSDEDKAVSNVLNKYNYDAYRISTGKWIKNKQTNHTDADGVWGTMILLPAELKSKFSV